MKRLFLAFVSLALVTCHLSLSTALHAQTFGPSRGGIYGAGSSGGGLTAGTPSIAATDTTFGLLGIAAGLNPPVCFGFGRSTLAATAVARSNNVVTVTFSNSFVAGQYVILDGVSGLSTSVNGIAFALATATATNFTFSQTGPNETSTGAGNVSQCGYTMDASGNNYTLGHTDTITYPNLQTSLADALILQNNTAATAGVPVQYSPAAHLSGTAWDSGASASKSQDWRELVIPASANPTTNRLSFQLSVGGSAYAEQFFVSGSGSTVDFLGITNGAAGAPGTLTLAPSGTDTNIGLLIQTKGTGPITLQPGTSGDSTTMTVLKQANGTVFASFDSTNQRLALGTSGAPSATLDIGGGKLTATNNGNIARVNGIATVGANGVLPQVAQIDSTGLGANVATATLYAVPAAVSGTYWISGYTVVTTPATTSSTLPVVVITWTDKDSSGVPSVTAQSTSAVFPGCIPTETTNTTATVCSFGPIAVSAKSSTNIQYATTGYASSGATAMTYALHVKVASFQ